MKFNNARVLLKVPELPLSDGQVPTGHIHFCCCILLKKTHFLSNKRESSIAIQLFCFYYLEPYVVGSFYVILLQTTQQKPKIIQVKTAFTVLMTIYQATVNSRSSFEKFLSSGSFGGGPFTTALSCSKMVFQRP